MNKLAKKPTSKTISIILAIALIGCICFSIKTYNDFVITKKILISEKLAIIKQLNKSKDSLELAISQNSSLNTNLIVERQKVTNLLDEINNTNIDVATLLKFKSEVARLQDIVASLTQEKFELKKNNELLKIERDSTILVLNNAQKYNDTLKTMNIDLNRVIKKGSKISIINLKTATGKQLSSGDIKFSDKAGNVNAVQVSFMVIGNKMTNPCDKEYYVQIIDSNNNVVGERKTKKFGPMVLNYSFVAPVKFKNETVEITNEMLIEKPKKGNYFVNVFDKGELASKTTFALR